MGIVKNLYLYIFTACTCTCVTFYKPTNYAMGPKYVRKQIYHAKHLLWATSIYTNSIRLISVNYTTVSYSLLSCDWNSISKAILADTSCRCHCVINVYISVTLQMSIIPNFPIYLLNKLLIGGSRNFWKGGLQPLMTTFCHHSAQKGGGVAALKKAKIDHFLVKFSDQRRGCNPRNPLPKSANVTVSWPL